METCAAYHTRLQRPLPRFTTNAAGVRLCGAQRGKRARKHVVVIASSSSSSLSGAVAATTRRTLASDWDVFAGNSVSSVTPSVSWLPRFEELDTTNMLLRQRIIFLGSQVDDVTADFIISQLLFLDAEDPKKDIRLFINSPGGSVTA
ncbi:hypothetical protein CRG98_022840, partial [Punica granatum]